MTWKPDYIDLSTLKDFLRIPAGDTQDDDELSLLITAASRAVDRRTGRQFGNVDETVTRVYRARPYLVPAWGLWVVDVDDLHDATGLSVDGTLYDDADPVLLPDNAPADGEPWTQLGFSSCPDVPLTVAAPGWGWAAVPAAVQSAVKLQCNRWNFRRDAPGGVAGSPDQGSEVRLLSKLDPDVATSLAGLSRRRRAG